VTYADLMATGKEDPTQNEAQLSLSRMQSTTRPMPPAALNLPPTAAEISALQNWINAGYPSGACSVDAGAGDSGSALAALDVFSGQPAFKAQTGSNSHNAGQNCMQCHKSGGGEAPQFMFGGTIYDGSGNAVAGAEILATPARVGARNATSKAMMISSMTTGGCSSCHCTGAGCTTTAVHLP
jgi:hypothetical protein